MIITVKIDGGFAYIPGLVKPITLDVSSLPADEAQKVLAMVQAANFFTLPATLNEPARGAADFQTYEITVQSGDCIHTVRAVEPIGNPVLEALVRRVQATR